MDPIYIDELYPKTNYLLGLDNISLGKEEFTTSDKRVESIIKNLILKGQVTDDPNDLTNLFEVGDILLIYPKREVIQNMNSLGFMKLNQAVERSSFTSVKCVYKVDPNPIIVGYSADSYNPGKFNTLSYNKFKDNFLGICLLKHRKQLTEIQKQNLIKYIDHYLKISPEYSTSDLILSTLSHWFPSFGNKFKKQPTIKRGKLKYYKSLICSTILIDIFNKANIPLKFNTSNNFFTWPIDFLFSESFKPSLSYFYSRELDNFLKKSSAEVSHLHAVRDTSLLATA